MRLFLTQGERQLIRLEKSSMKNLTEAEHRKIEQVRDFINMRRSFFISIVALIVSLMSLFQK